LGDEQLSLYRILSRARFPKHFVGKVFLTAFFGTTLPLLALLVCFARHRRFGQGGCASHPFGDGASHAGRDGIDTLGDVRALCACGAGFQGHQTHSACVRSKN
jgi:hypothetical protein